MLRDSCGCHLMHCSALDNATIQCLHGKMPVSKVTSAKRLSAEAWLKLSSQVHIFSLHYITEPYSLLNDIQFLFIVNALRHLYGSDSSILINYY